MKKTTRTGLHIIVNLCLLACLAVIPGTAAAQVVSDNNAVGVATTAPSSPYPSSLTATGFSVPVGNAKLLVVITRTTVSTTVSSLTFGSQNMTRLGSPVSNGGGRTEIWYLPLGNLSASVTDNITASFSGTSSQYSEFTAASFSGVDQTTPMNGFTSNVFTTAGSGNATPSLSISGNVGDLALEAISNFSTSVSTITIQTPASNQTALATCVATSLNSLRQTMALKAQTGSTQTLGWSVSNASTTPVGIQVAANIQQRSVALPVKLVRFTAEKAAGARNLIRWNTATEDPATVFSVERSADGTRFSPIGTETGKGGGSAYAFYDEQARSGATYYRLKITAGDGSSSYGNVALVRGDCSGCGIVVTPVPAVTSVRITGIDASLLGQTAGVYNMQGLEIARVALTVPDQRIDISSWMPGVYGLRLPSGFVLRLVKQ